MPLYLHRPSLFARAATVAAVAAIALVAGAHARADPTADVPVPIPPTLPAEAVLGIHRPWSPPVARDEATRAARRAEIEAQVREARDRVQGTTPPILFAEPPELASAPPPPQGPPPPPDSLVVGMDDFVVGDLNGDGMLDVATVRQADSTLFIRLNIGGGHYGPADTYSLANGAWRIALGDFNGDGMPDIAIGNLFQPFDHGYSVLMNLGAGRFGPRVDGALGQLPMDIYVVDLGHDGRADMIFTPFTGSHAEIVRSRPDGTFDPFYKLMAQPYDDPYHNPTVAVGDLDGDGNADIAITIQEGDCYYHRCLALAVFFGRADGTFGQPHIYHAPDGDLTASFSVSETAVTIQDIDGDSMPDMVLSAVQYSQPPTAEYYLVRNSGWRRFEAPFRTQISITPWILKVGTFRRGAASDLVVSDGATVELVLNTNDDSFAGEVRVGIGSLMDVRDLNGDGLSDLLIASHDTTVVLLADGTGGFSPKAPMTGSTFLADADFNGDHVTDLAVVLPNGNLGIRSGDGAGGFSAPIDAGIAADWGTAAIAADLDGDGLADLAVVHQGTCDSCWSGSSCSQTVVVDSLYVRWNQGCGFSELQVFNLGPDESLSYCDSPRSPMGLTAGDFDGDGRLDLAEVKGDGGGGMDGVVVTLRNLGHRHFDAPSAPLPASEDPFPAIAADLDGDGRADLVVPDLMTDYTGRFQIYHGLASGGVELIPGPSALGGYSAEHFAYSVASADFTADGRPDLAVGCGYAPGTGAAILVFPNITPGFGSTPTLASLVSSDATPGDVSLVWDLGASLASATIERRTATTDWAALASLSPDGSGRLRYDDRAVVAGARYAYRLRLGATTTTETWIDVPLAYTLAIRGATPNPSRGPLTVAFTLASAERAQLDVVDVAGRRVRSLDLAAPTAGAQSARLDAGSPLAPGLYFVRLVQGRARAMARVAVIR